MTVSFDTMVAAHLLNEELAGGEGRIGGLSLLNLGGLELGVDNWGKGKQDFGDGKYPPSDLWGEDGMGFYCAQDAAYTHLLYERYRDKLQADQDLARLMKYLVLPGLEAVVEMELNGIWVNTLALEDRKQELRDRIAGFEEDLRSRVAGEEFRASCDFSNDHFLRRWLFGRAPDGLGLTALSTTEKTGIAKVDEKALRQLAPTDKSGAVELLLTLKKAIKQLQFFESWKEHLDHQNRIHPHFNLTGTVTGRRSCDRPNLQQVPRDGYVRNVLGAPPGYRFLEVDYAALEVRIAAWLAGEEHMLGAFAAGKDPYRYTASIVYRIPEEEVRKDQRQKAKAVVLGFLYGMRAKSFRTYARDTFGVEVSEEEAEEFRDVFFNAYPGFVEWHERQRRVAQTKFAVRSPIGRARHLTNILSNDIITKFKAERQAINAPVQGLGGDLALASAVSLMGTMPRDECMLVGDVHDALLFQVRDDCWEKWAWRILSVMESPPVLAKFNISIPIRLKAQAKLGNAWGGGVEFSLSEFVVKGPDGEDVERPAFEGPGRVTEELREYLAQKLAA